MKKNITIGKKTFEISNIEVVDDHVAFTFNEQMFFFDQSSLSLINSEKAHVYSLTKNSKVIKVEDELLTVDLTPSTRASGVVSDLSYLSPMPGKITKVFKLKGDKVTKGETLLVLEAMKMEHSITAHADGVVKELLYNEGDLVSAKQKLVELES